MAFNKKRPPAAAAFVGIDDRAITREAEQLLASLSTKAARVSVVDDIHRTDEPRRVVASGKPSGEFDPRSLAVVPPGQRRVEGACGICGQTGTHQRERRSVPGAWFGLPTGKGPTDWVSIETCGFCVSQWERSEGVYYDGPPPIPAPVGFTVTERLRNPRSKHRRPAVLKGMADDEIIGLASLPKYTYAGTVITARVAGKPDPQPPAEPFGWLK